MDEGHQHQVFVIARIGSRYRGLAVLHHRHCYGEIALKACYRLTQIFQAEENRLALEHELRWAKNLQESDWTADISKKEDFVKFPFIQTCLAIGASFCAEETYYHPSHALPFNLPFNGGDNNNGITVLDISELSNVRYCFIGYHGMELHRPAPLMAPLYASEYLWVHHDINDPGYREEGFSLLKRFKDLDLVEAISLQSAWPTRGWNENSMKEEAIKSGTFNSQSLQQALPLSQTLGLVDFLSLVLEGPADNRNAQNLMQVPKFWSDFKSRLYLEPLGVSEHPAACKILSLALENDKNLETIDLSPFKLSEQQIGQVLLKSSIKSERITAMSLSGNQNLQGALLWRILKTYTNIRTLHLLNTPQISLAIKLTLMNGTRITELLATELLHRPFAEKVQNVTLTYNHPPVVQMGLLICGKYTSDEPSRLPDSRIDLGKLFTHKHSFISCALTAPFTNTNRATPEFLYGLATFVRFYISDNSRFANHSVFNASLEQTRRDIGRMLALSFASSTGIENQGKWKVNTLDDILYQSPWEGSWGSKLLQDKWSFVLIAEPRNSPEVQSPIIRYAFVGGGYGEVDFITLNIENFIQRVYPGDEAVGTRKRIVSFWEQCLEKPEGPKYTVGLCSEEQVESYMQFLDWELEERSEHGRQ